MSGPTPLPLVVGCGRSGTTLLRAMLDSHPELAVVHEAQFISRMAEHRSRYETPSGFRTDLFLADLGRAKTVVNLDVSHADVAAALEAAPPRGLADALRRVLALHAQAHAKPRYGEKSPRNVRHMPLLAELFPEARFIHLIRDGRDAAIARRDRGFGRSGVIEAAFVWRNDVQRARSDGARLGAGRYLELRYEDLVDAPAPTLTRVCEFIDLEYHPQMLDFHQRADAVVGGVRTTRPGIFENLNRPVTKGLRDWRQDMDPADVARFDAVGGPLLRQLGYEVSPPPTPAARAEVARGWVAWKAKMAAARLRLARSRRQSTP